VARKICCSVCDCIYEGGSSFIVPNRLNMCPRRAHDYKKFIKSVMKFPASNV
jgi:hypothetical protein